MPTAETHNAAATEPDAELIAICNRLIAIEAYRAKILYGPGSDDAHDAAVAPLSGEVSELLDRYIELPPPATGAGLRALAGAAWADAHRDEDGNVIGVGDGQELAMDVVKHILEGRGGMLAEPSFTTIGTLSDRMGHLMRRHGELDEMETKAPYDEKPALGVERDQFLDAILDVHKQILSVPALGLQDAAQQIGCCFLELEGGVDVRVDPLDVQRVRYGLLSALLAISRATGIDLSRIGWGKWDGIVRAAGLSLEAKL